MSTRNSAEARNHASAFRACRTVVKQPLQSCEMNGWATTLYVGDERRSRGLAYLPVPKSGSTMLRKRLAKEWGFRYHEGVNCGPKELFYQENRAPQHLRPTHVVWNGSSVCWFVQGGVMTNAQSQVVGSKLRIFTAVSDPLKHLYHGFAEVRHWQPNAIAYLLPDFERDLRRLYTCLAPGDAKRRPHFDVHTAPQAWHLVNTLRGGSLDTLWHLEDESFDASLDALLGSGPALLRNGSDASKAQRVKARRLRARRLQEAATKAQYSRLGKLRVDPTLVGQQGWARIAKLLPEQSVRQLCAVLQADYMCLGYPMPAACK